MRVGDFGAGSGHYTRALAGAVGVSGRVYAVDVQEDVLKHLVLHIPEHYRSVVETVWGNIEKPGGTKLRDASLDAVVLANVLFQVEHPAGLLAEVARVLKPGGKVLVVDWTGSHGGMGPDPKHVKTEQAAEAMFLDAGYTKVKSFHAGSHHYGVIFTKA